MSKLVFPLFIFLINFTLSFILSIHLSNQHEYTIINLFFVILLFSGFLLNIIFNLVLKRKLLNTSLFIFFIFFIIYIFFKSDGFLFADYGFIVDYLIFYNYKISLVIFVITCLIITYIYYSYLFIDVIHSKSSLLKTITLYSFEYKRILKLIFSIILILFYSFLIYRYLAFYEEGTFLHYDFENDYSIFSIDYRDVSINHDNYVHNYDKIFPNSDFGEHIFEEYFHPIEIFNNTQSTAFLIVMNFIYILIISKFLDTNPNSMPKKV